MRSLPRLTIETETAAEPMPLWAMAVCCALWAYWVALALIACPFEDTTRDIAAALNIVQGVAWPATGPAMANAAHLGPIWFYLLAPVVAVSSSWLGVALFMAALSALKFPLALSLGAALRDWRFGLLFAVALLLPGWQHLEAMLATHTGVQETLVLGYLLVLHRYLLAPSAWRSVQLGLLFALALHAHPAAVVLAPVTILSWLATRPSGSARIVQVVAWIAAASVPFLPYVLAQWIHGWPDAATSSIYLSDRTGWRQLVHVPALANAVFYSGPHALMSALLPRGAQVAAFIAWTVLLILSVIGAGVAWRLAEARCRSMVWWTLAVFFLTLCTMCFLRERTPWYMAYLPVLAGAAVLAAVWRVSLSAWPRSAWMLAVAASLCGLLGMSVDAGLWRNSARGEFTLPAGAMSNTLLDFAPLPPGRQIGGTSLAARYASASGEFLCTHPGSVLHGSYAGYVDDTGAIDARLWCRHKIPLAIGGAMDAPAAEHWLGIPRRLWQALGVSPDFWIGPFGMAHVEVLSSSTASLPVANADLYPTRDSVGPPENTYSIEVDLNSSRTLLLSNVLRYLAPIEIKQVTANGIQQAVLVQTAFVQTYRCAACAGSSVVHWQISFRAQRKDLLDVLSLIERD